MEVNDTNPLNNLRYTLKNSGKYMVDAVVLFSGNINYDESQQKVIFFPNDNIKAILDNSEKYIKPLKDAGMKVVMGVMCNHDRACITNLADNSAREFAQDLNALCDAYDLDGIFWDDEYCKTISPPPAGFVNPGVEGFSRLAYEVWKLQPQRWNVAYGFSGTGGAIAIDGVSPGTFIEYVLPDYSDWGFTDWSHSFEGMPLSHMGALSIQCRYGTNRSEYDLRNMRDKGYGAMMIFAMDPFMESSTDNRSMPRMARAFYNDEVVIDPVKYEKDW